MKKGMTGLKSEKGTGEIVYQVKVMMQSRRDCNEGGLITRTSGKMKALFPETGDSRKKEVMIDTVCQKKI